MSFDAGEWFAFAADLNAAPDKLRKAATVIVRKTTLDAERDAKAFCPVDTGNLRNSIRSSFAGSNATIAQGEIDATADYAAYVEYGTSRKGPAAFIGPAFDRQGPVFVAATAALGLSIV